MNSEDYMYGSKDVGNYNEKNLLDPQINGETVNKYLRFNCL